MDALDKSEKSVSDKVQSAIKETRVIIDYLILSWLNLCAHLHLPWVTFHFEHNHEEYFVLFSFFVFFNS